MKSPVAVLVALAVQSGCSSGAPAAPTRDGGAPGDPTAVQLLVSCDITPPTSCTDMSLRYADIAAIIQKSCAPCHAPGQPQWPLATYQDVVDWAQPLRDDLVACDMPPLDGGVAMTADDRMKVLTWLQCGEPQ
jgi:hypothetical protein